MNTDIIYQDQNIQGISAADTRDKHAFVCLNLDASSSTEAFINQINQAAHEMIDMLRKEDVPAILSAVAFHKSEAEIIMPPTTVQEAEFTDLAACGVTPLGDATELVLALNGTVKAGLNKNGIQYYRPIVVTISDGVPTDEMGSPLSTEKQQEIIDAIQKESRKKDILSITFSVGDNPGREFLRDFATTENGVTYAFDLDPENFSKAFQWLSCSVRNVTTGKGLLPGDPSVMPFNVDMG